MAKELPYFRFTVTEWLEDEISLESYQLKGVFADVCAWYWFRDCTVTLAMLEKKFRDAKAEIKELIELGIIKMDEDENITILFLNDQYDLLSEKRKKRSEAGRIGGLKKSSNAKAMLKQRSSYKDKDKDKDKDNIERRTQKFYEEIAKYSKQYDKKMLRDFFEYWSEPTKSKKQIRYELERTWDLSRRLKTWQRNEDKFNKNKIDEPKYDKL